MIFSYHTFIVGCNKGFCPRNTIYNKKTCARETKRVRCWEKYEKKRDLSKEKEIGNNAEWEEARREALERDGYRCRFVEILSVEEARTAKESRVQIPSVEGEVDPAHVIRRSQSKKLSCDPRNVIALQRIVHQRLDTYRNPLTGKAASREEIDNWWMRIIGREEWDYLQISK